MQRAVLLYNPTAGSQHSRRRYQVEAAVAALRAAGVAAEVVEIDSSEAAGEQARAAAGKGCDAVIACGGDGTLHAVLQGMVGTPGAAALGVLPMGTGNVLAKNLGLPLNCSKAAEALLTAKPKPVAVGQIDSTGEQGERLSRYFLLNAGAGLDGLGIYGASHAMKSRMGQAAYYMHGLGLVARYSFPLFTAEFEDTSGKRRREQVSEAGAFRVRTLGGLIGSITPGADLLRDDLQLILFKTRRRLRFVQYSIKAALNWRSETESVELAHARELRCTPLEGAGERIHVQSDGEWLGYLPARISMAAEPVQLLFP